MGHTHRYQFGLKKKKKNQVKSLSPESRVPETGSHQPIGSGRDSGRDREREKQSSLLYSQDFVGRISLGQELKLLYATRATRGYRNHKISPRFKVRVFMKTEKWQCPWKPRHLR